MAHGMIDVYVPWALQTIREDSLIAMARAMDLTSETMRYQSFRTTLRALSFMATSPTWRTAEQLHSRRRACRFSWNLRHVLNNHMVANHETNPPTYSRAIDIVTPIYARIEDALNAAEILMYTAPDFQWQVNTEGIRQDFNSLMAQWHDYMTHQQLVYRTKYVQVTDSLHEVEDHLNSLKAIRMSCRTERSRIQLANITYQLAAVSRCSRCLDTAFAVLLYAYPGADRI
jgi:hypothetical protein